MADNSTVTQHPAAHVYLEEVSDPADGPGLIVGMVMVSGDDRALMTADEALNLADRLTRAAHLTCD